MNRIKMSHTPSTPKLKTWWYAARPHTLAASIAPMIVVTGALIGDSTSFSIIALILCWIVALTAQIASNMANDYYDYKNGIDDKRTSGFDRLLIKGGMTPREMFSGLIVVVVICIIVGAILCALQDIRLLWIGVAILLGIFAYSAEPFPLSQYGLGDVAVVLFFGIVPIMVSYYAASLESPPLYVLFLGLAIGFWEANILVVNNYRDHDDDKEAGKKTIIVRMGKKSGPIVYAINAGLSLACIVVALWISGHFISTFVVAILLLFPFVLGFFGIKKCKGKRLNSVLVYTSKVALLTSIILFISLLF